MTHTAKGEPCQGLLYERVFLTAEPEQATRQEAAHLWQTERIISRAREDQRREPDMVGCKSRVRAQDKADNTSLTKRPADESLYSSRPDIDRVEI